MPPLFFQDAFDVPSVMVTCLPKPGHGGLVFAVGLSLWRTTKDTVSITSGKEVTFIDGTWRVPKRELVRGLVTALETGRLRIAKGLPYVDILKAELKVSVR